MWSQDRLWPLGEIFDDVISRFGFHVRDDSNLNDDGLHGEEFIGKINDH